MSEVANIIKELKVQTALQTLSSHELTNIIKFIAKNSTDIQELTLIFWMLIDHDQYNHSIYQAFRGNENVPDIMKKYILPLANNRPIPESLEKEFPRD